jgi:hypothetical protein
MSEGDGHGFSHFPKNVRRINEDLSQRNQFSLPVFGNMFN